MNEIRFFHSFPLNLPEILFSIKEHFAPESKTKKTLTKMVGHPPDTGSRASPP